MSEKSSRGNATLMAGHPASCPGTNGALHLCHLSAGEIVFLGALHLGQSRLNTSYKCLTFSTEAQRRLLQKHFRLAPNLVFTSIQRGRRNCYAASGLQEGHNNQGFFFRLLGGGCVKYDQKENWIQNRFGSVG